ncbi:MAG: FG-GAP-like repeat-containing protein [Planctomycetota bacterium]|nr:FG-GAP-like repeat-containing protein [Planctomycetota bacterium]
MRHLLLLILLLPPAPASAQVPNVEQLLRDHAAALGDAGSVRSLAAASFFQTGGRRLELEEVWRLPGECRRAYRSVYGLQQELFGPAGAYTLIAALPHRWRAGTISGRAGYALFRTLAHPFPLLPYAADPAAAKRLRRVAVKGEGLVGLATAPDRDGLETIYVLDAQHHLRAVWTRERGQQPFAIVTYDMFRKVEVAKEAKGAKEAKKEFVLLPHLVQTEVIHAQSDPVVGRWKRAPETRLMRVEKYELNPEVAVRFVPPAATPGKGMGFERRTLATGPNPQAVAAADLDGDGVTDYATACDGGLYVHFAGAEDRPVHVPLGKGTHRGLAVTDMNLDGRPELVTVSHVEPGETIFFVTFDRARKPAVQKFRGAPAGTSVVLVRDLDLDGIPDLILSGVQGRAVQILYGNGFVGLRPVGVRPNLDPEKEGRFGYSVAVSDLNGDGLSDLVVADGRSLVLLHGTPQGGFSFGARTKAGPRPTTVALMDLERDGFEDVLVVNSHPYQAMPGAELIVLRNDGKQLTRGRQVDVGAMVVALATGDFNGDGLRDLVSASFTRGQVGILHGDGKGGFGRPAYYASGRGVQYVAVFDVDGDGRDDVLAANGVDDSFCVFRNTGNFAPPARPELRWARLCPPPTKAEFRLEGLSRTYEFAGEFRLPADIQDPSGLGYLSGGEYSTRLVLVSDKQSALFRATLDRVEGRLLVGPAIPLLGLNAAGPLDFEAIAVDRKTLTLFIGLEADSTVLRTTLYGHVLGRAKTPVKTDGRDGIEALATRRVGDDVLLYVFKERVGKTLKRPPVFILAARDDPFALELRGETPLPVYVADQTGAAYDGESLLVVSRLAREILEVPLTDSGFGGPVRRASFRKLTDTKLGLVSGDPKRRLFGMVEAIAVSVHGDLFLLVDNNREKVGIVGRNRGAEGRLLWFREVAK